MATPSYLHLSFLPPLLFLIVEYGRCPVEGQRRKFILPEPPALFHMVRWGRVSVLRKCVDRCVCMAGEQDREVEGRKKWGQGEKWGVRWAEGEKEV